jgi:CheY-like chemotaxis protein
MSSSTEKNVMELPTRPPLVLIVDDDPVVGRRVQRHFVDIANLGCLFVPSLREAIVFINSPEYDIRAVVTDWSFSEEPDDKNLCEDGLDLISYVEENLPKITCYLMTAHIAEREFTKRIEQFPNIQVFYKGDFQFMKTRGRISKFLKFRSPRNPDQPWNVVRMDYEKKGYISNPELIAKIDGISIDDAHERFKNTEAPSFLTYIQRLSNELCVIKPIPVHVSQTDDGFYKAVAPVVGLMVDGFGETPHDAIEELDNIIVDHFNFLTEQENLEGYSLLVRIKLEEYLTKGEKAQDTHVEAR